MSEDNSVVIDANVVIHGRGELPYNNIITSNRVYKEILSDMSKFKLESIDLKRLTPSEEVLSKVKSEADEKGLLVSDADCSIVALGLEKSSLVISDDKGVQNLCMVFNVDFDSYLGDTIEREMSFSVYCDNCGEGLGTDEDSCSFCGSSDFVRKRDN